MWMMLGRLPVRPSIERLCNEKPPEAVTVRQIAEEAGVHHGLVHHYFASKHALLAATMLRVEQAVLEAVEPVPDHAEAIGAFFDQVAMRPTYPRLLSWIVLEGFDPAGLIESFPVVDHLSVRIASVTGRSTAPLRTQALLTFVAGWATTSDFMADATGLSAREGENSHAYGRSRAIAIALGPS